MKDKLFKKTVKGLVSPGTYFLGDPSYILNDRDYDEMIKRLEKVKKNAEILKTVIQGSEVILIQTLTGDGVSYDNKNRKYGIDSGQLSLISSNYIIKKPNNHTKKLYHKIKIDKTSDVSLEEVHRKFEEEEYIGSILTIGPLQIGLNVDLNW